MDIMVSVLTTAFNHEKYIAQAIEGILSQKTDFRIELIIHDDASTDQTADIIRKYEEKYPDIIRPIYQTENQYSKKVNIYSQYMTPMIRGKYIAFCEGDDFWCDEEKLQKQVEFMENNAGFSACVHNTLIQNTETNEEKVLSKRKNEGDLSFGDVSLCGSYAYHTSSLLVTRDVWLISNSEEYPACFQMCPWFGDYQFSMFLALKGKIHFLPGIMSEYRLFTVSSWSKKQKELPVERKETEVYSILKMLDAIDEYTGHEYAKELQNAKDVKCTELMSEYRRRGIKERAKKQKIWSEISWKRKITFITNYLISKTMKRNKKNKKMNS